MKKHLIWAMATALVGSLVMLSACNKNDGGGPIAPIAPIPGGSGYPGYGQRIGFYAQSSNFSSYGFYNNGSSFTTSAAFKNVLKEAMGVCDRAYSNGGVASCDFWMQNALNDLVFMMDGSTAQTVRVYLRSYPVSNNYYWYGYQLPNPTDFFLGILGFPVLSNFQGWFNPLILDATIWPISNNAGFEIRANGPTGSTAYNKLFQIQVASGKVEDQSFQYKLFYNGAQVASGTMVRCQSQNCGLQ